MWLLDRTHTLKLKSFLSPETVSEPYAIISHFWDDLEQYPIKIRQFTRSAPRLGRIPAHSSCPKIDQKGCCSLARQHAGCRWVWIDPYCIDKTSSAELSEAINSMYRYYFLAAVCYAYRLHPCAGALESGPRGESHFARSKWHTRGWTSQELIAPRFVLLVSRTWDVLGSKADDLRAQELESITHIPASVLRLERRPRDMRISGAASRTTTRLEDEAYCLLGLFGINMPTLYGEGRNALRRLQEEIMRMSDDTIYPCSPRPRCGGHCAPVMHTTGLLNLRRQASGLCHGGR
ncbi:hypothetical protein C8Q80DRAFT_915339 [Daedaleopsis nitida]|nr:hypothetical protein C8Q80DRAFT_915339 [Daedaleopsis nitida]